MDGGLSPYWTARMKGRFHAPPDENTVHLFRMSDQNATTTGVVFEGGPTVIKGSRVPDVTE